MVSLLVIGGSGVSAKTVDKLLSEEEMISFLEFCNRYNVGEETQVDLLKKLKKGEKWDSMRGVAPISSHNLQLDNGEEVSIKTFEDGSIIVSGIDITEAEITTNDPSLGNSIGIFAIDPGTVTSGSGYSNYKGAKVYQNNYLVNAHFYADFTLVQGTYNDYITRVYDEKVIIIGGSVSNVQLSITKGNEDMNGVAQARLSFEASGLAGGANGWLKLNVGNNQADTSYSF